MNIRSTQATRDHVCKQAAPERGPAQVRRGYLRHCTLLAYYLVLSSFFIGYYRHGMDPDGTSYVSLALKYLHGDLGSALNGHWSPMISWILVPFLSLGLEPTFAFKIASLGIGVVTLAGIDRLMTELAISWQTRILYLTALVPVVAWYAQSAPGADLLSACILLFYLHAVLSDGYRKRRYTGITVGLLGAGCYLAKSYNFYFFLLHFACVNLCYRQRAADAAQKKTVVINMALALTAFVLVSGIWIALISVKYHTPTVSTAGGYNLSHIRPGHATDIHPMATDGLMVPPNATAISVWEDPKAINLVQWNPFASPPDFLHYLRRVRENTRKYLGGLSANYILDLTFVALAVLYLKKMLLNRKVGDLLLTVMLYPLGYLALYYDGQRYVLIVPILLYVLSAYLVDLLLAQSTRKRLLRIGISLVLCGSLLGLTLVRMKRDHAMVTAQNATYRAGTAIDNHYDMNNANVASRGGSWDDALSLCYFLKARYFGKVRDGITDRELHHELTKHRIKYLLVFGNLANHPDFLDSGGQVRFLPGDITVFRVAQ